MKKPIKIENKVGKKGGRPSELSEEKVKKLEEAFSFDATIEEACFYADITKQTYYNWLERLPALVDRFEALRNNPVMRARQAVITAFEADPNLALKYLERKRRAEFALRQELTGEDGNSIKLDVDVTDAIKTLAEIKTKGNDDK
jgi:hypothetical protein